MKDELVPITADEIRKFAPRALPEYVDAIVSGWSSIQAVEINTPLRLCEFLAQAAHETGGFTILAEDTCYSVKNLQDNFPHRFEGVAGLAKAKLIAGNEEKVAESLYGGRLGNCDAGDGFKYRGRGFFQDTGRYCYREYGELIGEDLEADPDLLERPAISLKSACARWQRMRLNRLADRHYTRAIGNAINRGNAFSSKEPIGAESRLAWFSRAWTVFGDGGPVPAGDGLALGAYGPRVEALQLRLKALGYGVGAVDKVFGPGTAAAVAAFKLEHKHRGGAELEPDEIVGPLTDQALEAAPARAISPERAEATEHDLAAVGSTEVKAGQQQAAIGQVATVAAGIEASRQAGVFDMAKENLGWVPSAHTFLVPVIDALKWAFANAFWVGALVGGVWFWVKGREMIAARLAAHRSGANMGR